MGGVSFTYTVLAIFPTLTRRTTRTNLSSKWVYYLLVLLSLSVVLRWTGEVNTSGGNGGGDTCRTKWRSHRNKRFSPPDLGAGRTWNYSCPLRACVETRSDVILVTVGQVRIILLWFYRKEYTYFWLLKFLMPWLCCQWTPASGRPLNHHGNQ